MLYVISRAVLAREVCFFCLDLGEKQIPRRSGEPTGAQTARFAPRNDSAGAVIHPAIVRLSAASNKTFGRVYVAIS